MTQGHFIMGVMHKPKLMHSGYKKCWVSSASLILGHHRHQTMNLALMKQVIFRTMASRDQAIQINNTHWT